MAMPLKARIVQLLRTHPGLSDRELTDRLFGVGAPQQPVNIACRDLERRGELRREKISTNPIANFLVASAGTRVVTTVSSEPSDSEPLSEDGIKRSLKVWLEAQGWVRVTVAWGHDRGIDIEAVSGGRKWIIEVKGPGSRPEMRVNYFLAILGETLQRMYDPAASYSVALPDLPQFRGLWERLPKVAKERTGITALFVAAGGTVVHVR